MTQPASHQHSASRVRAGVNLANIPGELKMLPQWVTWIWTGQVNPATGKRDKLLMNPHTGIAAASNDASTWGTFDQAVHAYQRRNHAGIGFVFSDHDPYAGVDLDNCIDPFGIKPWAQEIIDALATYCEVSPSGTGVKLIAIGVLPSNVGSNKKKPGLTVEMYDRLRFFTLTGNLWPNTPTTINDASQELIRLHTKLKPPVPKQAPRSAPAVITASDPRAQAWAQRVIDYACDQMRQAQPGTKHRTRLNMGRMLGGLVAHGLLSSQDAADLIYHANPPQANDSSERKAIMDGIALGVTTPLDAPDMPPSTEPLYIDGLACCPLHLTELRQSNSAGWYCPTQANGGYCDIWFDGQGYTPPAAPSPPNNPPPPPNMPPTYPPVNYDDIPPMPPGDVVTVAFDEGESGDARLLHALYQGRLAWDSQLERWHAWNGRYWIAEDVSLIRVLIEQHVGGVYRNYAQKQDNAAARELDLNRRAELYKIGNEYRKRAYALHQLRRLNSIATLAQHWFRVKGNIWDANPYQLAVENGVIDLATGQLLAPDPAMYIRRVAPTAWTGDQTAAPRWEQFLNELFEPGSEYAEISAYLQRLLGHGLLGIVREHILAVFWGEGGRNGKGTMMRTLRRVLGDYASPVPRELMIDTGRQSAANAAAPQWLELQGKRIVWGSEVDAGAKVSMAAAKFLSGGDEVSARPIQGKEYIKFDPSHQFILLTNPQPRADSNDDPFWQRLQLVPFTVRFLTPDKMTGAANERAADNQLEDKLVNEASGILAWLVRGCLEYQRSGIQPPEIVRMATQDYRDDGDTLKLFLDETCIENSQLSVGAQDLFNAYKDWCVESGINHPMKRPDFYKQVDSRFAKQRTSTGNKYIGLSLIVPGVSP